MKLIRKCEIFLQKRGELLGEHGFTPDSGRVERTESGNFVFYHYTRRDRLEQIFAPGSGLQARLPVVYGERFPHLSDTYLVEGFLEPLPAWITNSPYFGDLARAMMQAYVGNLLLRVEIPAAYPGLYVADAAHNFEAKHFQLRGETVLNLGYDCRTGREVMLAEANSYIPMAAYHGGHVAPNVKAIRRNSGIVIPNEYLSVCETQPLLDE